MTAAFAFSSREAVLEVEQALGQDVEDRALGDVLGLDRGVLGVAHQPQRLERRLLAGTAGAAVPEGQRQALLRHPAQAAGDLEDEREGEEAEGAAQGELDERAPQDLRGLAAVPGGGRRGRGTRPSPQRVASSTCSSSDMRVLAQCTAPSPMPRRLSARVTPRATCDALVIPMTGHEHDGVDVDGEVRDDEEQRGDDRDREERGDLLLGPAGGVLAEVGGAGDVHRHPRVGEALGEPVTVALVERRRCRGRWSGPPRRRGWCPARSSGYRSVVDVRVGTGEG